MTGGFKFLEHTADVYIESWGGTLEETFEWAAVGMFEVMTDLKRVEAKKKYEISVKGEDLYALLYEWLEELLFIFGSQGTVFSKFRVHKITKKEDNGYILFGEAWGETFDIEKHTQRTEVKAITYSLMEIIKNKSTGQWTVRFVLDI